MPRARGARLQLATAFGTTYGISRCPLPVASLDAAAFGFWLKMAFGAPTIAGTKNRTLMFNPGSWKRRSMAIEVAIPETPGFTNCAGCILDQPNWDMQRSGLLTADIKLLTQGENVAIATAVVWPTGHPCNGSGISPEASEMTRR